jgi:hypothetical protein
VQAQGNVGGDLPRIELQQAFVSSIIQKVNSQGILSNSVELLKVANTATQSLTVDQGLNSVTNLLGLARSLTHLHAKNVTLMTMPTVPDTNPGASGRLLPAQPADDVIFQMILHGQTWHHRLPTMATGKVKVRVLNGAGTAGLAGRTAGQLRKLGYDVIGVGNAPATAATALTYSGTAQADSAYTLMTALKSAPAVRNLLAEPARQTGSPGPVTLTLGSNFHGVNQLAPGHAAKGHHAARGGSGSQGAGASVQTRNAGANICSGLPSANPHPGRP